MKINNFFTSTVLGVSLIGGISGCGKHTFDIGSEKKDKRSEFGSLDTTGKPSPDGWILKARGTIKLNLGESGWGVEPTSGFFKDSDKRSLSESHPVSVTVASNVSFTTDGTELVAPGDLNGGLLNFGKIKVTSLTDNDLFVCGESGTDKCTEALVRSFTTGVAGEGLWNTDNGYGLPILVNDAQIGFEVGGATSLYTVEIGEKNQLKLKDFTGGANKMNLGVKIDFGNAGIGNYSTSIVVEYLVR